MRILLFTILLIASALVPNGQDLRSPERQKLLNGLRILLWQSPGQPEVLIKLRIHAGAAFDPAGKSGTMATLGDILFPEATYEYFRDEMNGKLEVDTNYDSMTITMQGKASALENMIEILHGAVVTTQITPAVVSKVQEGRIRIIRETAVSPTVLADRAIASRLFGEFPYGRPVAGSVESLARIERADLMLARERFFNADNATLVIRGGFQKNRALRATRQLLGGWHKSGRMVPSTFRQPDKPDPKILIVNSPADRSAEIRLAVRGLAHNDPDFSAVSILESVMRKRWEKFSGLTPSPLFVRHESHYLPGMFVMGASVDTSQARKMIEGGYRIMRELSSSPIGPSELAEAQHEVRNAEAKQLGTPEGLADAWLDVDTFGLTSVAELALKLNSLSTADVQRVATRLFGGGAFASVALGDAKALRGELESIGIQVMGEIVSPKSKAESVAKPPKK